MSASKASGLAYWAMAVSSVAVVSYRYLVPGAPGGAPPILANRFTHLGDWSGHVDPSRALLRGAV